MTNIATCPTSKENYNDVQSCDSFSFLFVFGQQRKNNIYPTVDFIYADLAPFPFDELLFLFVGVCFDQSLIVLVLRTNMKNTIPTKLNVTYQANCL